MHTLFGIFNKNRRFEQQAERWRPQLKLVNDLAAEMKQLGEAELKQRVAQYRGRTVAELQTKLPEIFATIREASERILKMRHFDVQIIGGFVLLQGQITEMKTGEGKTLVATLPLIVHGLTGQGAHLVTVNEYLAQRDADWMGPLYNFFGLTVGVVSHGQTAQEKREAYAADITYGTNNEFGFDYLRDNMAQRLAEMAQRQLNYAIVDEVDSILIDEARTPLIISAPDEESTQLYQKFAQLVPQLKADVHYNIDEKRKAATLTDEGVNKVEELLGVDNIYAEQGVRSVHHLEQALRAQTLFHRDKDYVVKDGQVVIVDEFTGRLMEGRRYSEGLHQAIEAKERVHVQQESRTLATITFQNFFRLYKKLAGMTGTAATSAEEFEKVYNLEVAVVPPNKPLVRHDRPDKIFVNEQAKFRAVVREIKQRHDQGQPVLVGTIAIEKSEYVSALLTCEGVPHEVLNAKHHAREAEIIARAGQKGAVTISTNMAGRGTDIKLGEGVTEKGGLFVLGTERHEARRIDNQLRGRSGRQGDPGETQFFVSMEDDVMRIFGGDKVKHLMERLRVPEDEAIENRMVSRALTGAQERVEGYYFDMRRQVLAYDDVLNRQRNAIYTLRRGVMQEKAWREAGSEKISLKEKVKEIVAGQVDQLMALHAASGRGEEWNTEEIAENVAALGGRDKQSVQTQLHVIKETAIREGGESAREELTTTIKRILEDRLKEREREMGEKMFQELAAAAALRAIDVHWMDHLATMDYLRTGIGLRGYGQRDPLVEYQREGYRLFQQLLMTIKASLLEVVYRAQPVLAREEIGEVPRGQESGGEEGSALHQLVKRAPGQTAPVKRGASGQLSNQYKNVGRNDLCPCGSGKKFKRCHGK